MLKTSKSKPDFDFIASFYQLIGRLIFQEILIQSQIHFLNFLKAHSHIVIVGGGNGKILPYIFQFQPKSTVSFIEPSAKMMKLAKEEVCLKCPSRVHQIRFLQHDVEEFNFEGVDVVILPFVLDLFQPTDIDRLLRRIRLGLNPDGLMIHVDFYISETPYWKQKMFAFLTRLLYLFFHLTANVNVQPLPNFHLHYISNSFEMVREKRFYFGWIRSAIYQPKYSYP